MHIQAASVNEIFLADTQYLERLAYRRRLICSNPDEAIGFLPRASDAVSELYGWIVTEWLPTRWARHFACTKDGKYIYNSLLDVNLPKTPPLNMRDTLEILMAQAVEEDLLLLLPISDPGHPRNGKYQLVAYAASGPTGFSWSNKLGLALADIHGPGRLYKYTINCLLWLKGRTPHQFPNTRKN